MTLEKVREHLSRIAPRDWELYSKTAESRELFLTNGQSSSAWRREEGWAARWWDGALRFASASSEADLDLSIEEARRFSSVPEQSPDWPAQSAALAGGVQEEALDLPPDLFSELSRALAAESRGEALLTGLTLRRGKAVEGIENARGLRVSFATCLYDGVAVAVGRRGASSCEGRVVFRWEREPELAALAQRLSDRVTYPLSNRPASLSRGEWLLDPSVASALLAAMAPLFCADAPPRWFARAGFASPCVTLVDDACADAFCDGEGTPTRRVVLAEKGVLRSRLHDLRSAKRTGHGPTGHGVRPSYRTPPRRGPRRLFLETSEAVAPADLLPSVRRGLFARALTAPVRLDLENDRYEVEFTGVAIAAGRAEGPVAGARASGRVSELLRRISQISTDRRFFPMPYPVGAPTVLVGRASFD